MAKREKRDTLPSFQSVVEPEAVETIRADRVVELERRVNQLLLVVSEGSIKIDALEYRLRMLEGNLP